MVVFCSQPITEFPLAFIPVFRRQPILFLDTGTFLPEPSKLRSSQVCACSSDGSGTSAPVFKQYSHVRKHICDSSCDGLRTNNPWLQKPYRLSMKAKDQCQWQLKGLLKAGSIQSSRNPGRGTSPFRPGEKPRNVHAH